MEGDLARASCCEVWPAWVGECTVELTGDLGFLQTLEGGALGGCLDASGETVEAGWEPVSTLVFG